MHKRSMGLMTAALVSLLMASSAAAQDDDPVGRLDEALRRPHTVVDTALVFTNLGNTPSTVRLIAYDHAGARAGSKEIEVPGNGLSFVLASDLVDTTDPRRFIGKVVSRGTGRLAPSAVLFGGALTDVPADVSYGRLATTSGTPQAYSVMTFPLVATY